MKINLYYLLNFPKVSKIVGDKIFNKNIQNKTKKMIDTIKKDSALFNISLGLFVFGVLIGVMVQLAYPELIQHFIDQFSEYLRSIVDTDATKSSMMVMIFLNNLRVAIMAFLLGIIFGIVPTMVLIVNGVILGVLGTMMGQNGNLLTFLVLIIPHGVIEIPAILFSCVAGYKLFLGWISNKRHLKKEFNESLLIIAGVSVMLFLAAIIESFFTSTLA